MILAFGHIIAATALTIGLTISSFAQADQEDTTRQSFEVDPGGTLIVDTDTGDIRVRSGASREVTITIHQNFRTSNRSEIEDIRDRLHIDMDQRGNDVIVTVELDRPARRWFGYTNDGNHLQLSFDIRVPERFNADLETSDDDIIVGDLTGDIVCRTSDGDIRISDIDGPIRASTSDGDITLGRIAGTVTLKTSDGDIEADSIGGDIDATTSDGNIIIEHAAGFARMKTSDGNIRLAEIDGAVDAKTSDGNLIVMFIGQPDRNCRMTTSDGDITVHLQPSCRFSLDARANDGDISAEGLTVKLGRRDKHHLVADLNGGGPELYLRTSDGNIDIRER